MKERFPLLCAENREALMTNLSTLPVPGQLNSTGSSYSSYYCNELWNASWTDHRGNQRTSRNLDFNEDICPIIHGNNLIHFQDELKFGLEI